MRSNLHTLAGRPGISNDLIVLMAFLLLKKKYSKQTKFSIFYTITQHFLNKQLIKISIFW